MDDNKEQVYDSIIDSFLADRTPDFKELGLKEAEVSGKSIKDRTHKYDDGFASGLKPKKAAIPSITSVKENWHRNAGSESDSLINELTMTFDQAKKEGEIEKKSISDSEVKNYIKNLLNQGEAPAKVAAKIQKLAELELFNHQMATDYLQRNAGMLGLSYLEPNTYMDKANPTYRHSAGTRITKPEKVRLDSPYYPAWKEKKEGCKMSWTPPTVAQFQAQFFRDFPYAPTGDASVQLFRFAREREYLPDSITVAEKVKRLKIKARADDIEIWSLAEMRMLLKHVREEYLPWMVIGAFAGVRTEEICPNITSHKDPLRWEDIQWDEKQIMVRAETSKVGRTRFVPMQCNLLAWLQSYRDRKGPVLTCPVNTLYNELKLMRTRIRKAAKNAKNEEFEKFTFKKNALRHSFGSYRNAIIRSIGQLSDEMGNSPAIAKCNYERPQPRAVADEWFSIMPENKSK